MVKKMGYPEFLHFPIHILLENQLFVKISKNQMQLISYNKISISFKDCVQSQKIITVLDSITLKSIIPLFVTDKVCKRPWNFERVPNSIIQGHDRALIFTSTKEACLAACLNEVSNGFQLLVLPLSCTKLGSSFSLCNISNKL